MTISTGVPGEYTEKVGNKYYRTRETWMNRETEEMRKVYRHRISENKVKKCSFDKVSDDGATWVV